MTTCKQVVPKHRHNIQQIDGLQMEIDILYNRISQLESNYEKVFH